MLVSGSMISTFRVVSLLGKSETGEVYLGFDTQLNRDVAIKELYPELTSDADFPERFRQEEQTLAKLTHPGIVSLISMREEFGTYYLIMEYASGRTLKDIVTQGGPLPEKRAMNILRQLLSALKYAHEKGVIHRSIKPSKIIVDADDNVKITDFGVAHLVGEKIMLRPGQNPEAVYYLSPEQVQKAPDIDARTDIFSLGVTFFEMLAGRVPYTTDTTNDFTITDEIVHRHIDDPRNFGFTISGNTVRILMKMVEKDRGARFSNCASIFFALQEPDFPAQPIPAEPHPSQHHQQYQSGYQTTPPGGIFPKTYLTEAILVTIFCCWPFGIPAIINASNVSTAIRTGDYNRAEECSRKAKSWVNTAFWIGIVFGIIGIVANISKW